MNPNAAFSLLPQAEEDLQRIAAFVGQADREKTVEFLRAARTTVDFLAGAPLSGSPQFFENPRHHSLRRFRVAGFKNYFIWYRSFVTNNGIEV